MAGVCLGRILGIKGVSNGSDPEYKQNDNSRGKL